MKTEESKRMLALACTVADLKTENMYLAQRVQELVDEYNEVAHQLHGKDKRNDEDQSMQTLDDMQHLRDHCDKLEKDIEQLKRDCIQLQIEYNEAKTHADKCELQKEELLKRIARFDNSEFLKIGDDCTLRDSLSSGSPVKVGSGKCCSCPHLIKVDVFGKKCVLCACRYDNTKAEEAQECKSNDD